MSPHTRWTPWAMLLPSLLVLIGFVLGWMTRTAVERPLHERPAPSPPSIEREAMGAELGRAPVDSQRVQLPAEDGAPVTQLPEVESTSTDESGPPPTGTPESKRWWRRKLLADARQRLLEAPPTERIGPANTALCLAIATIFDAGRSNTAQASSPGGHRVRATHAFSLNGRTYNFTSDDFPEYTDLTAAMKRQITADETGEPPTEPQAMDSDLERRLFLRLEEALGLLADE